MIRREIKIFSGNANRPLAERVCDRLELPLGPATVGRYPDGEIEVKINDDVRGRDCFVIQPTCPPVNEHLLELLIMIDALRRASAGRITAVIPYFGYARKDRKDEGRVPITAKLVANMITVSGVDRVLTLDLHAAQLQGFFDLPVDHLYAGPIFVRELRARIAGEHPVVVAPDVGSARRARGFAKRMEAGLAIVDKRRVSDRETEVHHIIGEVKDLTAIFIDDMISTAGTLVKAAEAVASAGARRILLCATHAVLCGAALERLEASPAEAVFVTDTIPLARSAPKLHVLSVDALLADVIRRIHLAESVSIIFNGPGF